MGWASLLDVRYKLIFSEVGSLDTDVEDYFRLILKALLWYSMMTVDRPFT